jgi:hypothetical protein
MFVLSTSLSSFGYLDGLLATITDSFAVHRWLVSWLAIIKQKGSRVDAEDKLRFDYEQTHELIRMFTDIRFKLLAFVPTLTGATVALLSGVDNLATTLMLGLLGLFVTLGIVSYEMRNTFLYDAAIHRAKCLELRLGLPLFTQGKTMGGVFNERPPRPMLFRGSKLFIELYRWKVTKEPALIVWHDQALAFVYGSSIGGWAYIIVGSLLALPAQQRSGMTFLVAILAAGLVAFLCMRGLIRFDKRPGPRSTSQCSEGSEIR